MIEEIISFFKNKKIVILGFGLEGKSTYNFIRKHLIDLPIVVVDSEKNLKRESEYLKNDKNLYFKTGDRYLDGIEKFDIIMKSPGISFKNVDISKFENKIMSQLELLLEYSKNFIIGITGTKGKSTTSSLIYEMLKDQNEDVKLLGNIGIPIFDEIEKINENTIMVIEISSHALQYIRKSPNLSIILNLFEEHLDHYKSFEEYGDAKFNIFRFQKDKDIAIFNLENENMNNKNYPYKVTDYAVTINNKHNNLTDNTIYVKDRYVYCNENKIYNIDTEKKLKGYHNLNNIMFVLAVGNILNLNLKKTIETIKNFSPLEHRLEYVGTFNNIEYYNDSIATVPEATIESIKALENVATLIVGGNDRGVSQQKLIEFLKDSSIKNILCLPKTGEYIYKGLKGINGKIIKEVEDMSEAVELAKKITNKHSICLLSPAASSYGYFKNFKERGNLYKKLVKGD